MENLNVYKLHSKIDMFTERTHKQNTSVYIDNGAGAERKQFDLRDRQIVSDHMDDLDRGYRIHFKESKCRLCGKEFKRLATHFKTHQTNKLDYYREFNRELYLQELKMQVINDFYISYRKQFITMNEYKEISTIKRTLTNADVKKHLECKDRVGIKFGNTSSLIGLDLDIRDAGILEDIYNLLLNYGIPEDCILTTFSGNKGYHIDIFLAEHIDIKFIQAFYQIVLSDLGLSEQELELRGGSYDGYFLPFGINYKAKGLGRYTQTEDKLDGYCGVVSQYGLHSDIEQEIQKLEGLDKVDAEIVKDIVFTNYPYLDKLNHPTKPAKKDTIEDAGSEQEELTIDNAIDSLNSLGIYNSSIDDIVDQIGSRKHIEQGKRHRLAFVYAIALRDSEMDARELEQELLRWHSDLKSGYTSSWAEIVADCKSIVKSVFKPNPNGIGYKYFIPSRQYRQYVTKQDIERFAGLKSNALKKTYLALTIHANTYADADGNFYMTYEQMGELLGSNINRGVLMDYIGELQLSGVVEVVERGQYKKPNKYKLRDFVREPAETDIYYLDSFTRQEMHNAITELFSPKQIRSRWGGARALNKMLDGLGLVA